MKKDFVHGSPAKDLILYGKICFGIDELSGGIGV